ncbi:MAG: hypothetical protein K8H88_17890 [Sandaracinaceae bacterium]|nr:hypothetical protein [Sandaracinaceae bacterium]
MAKPRRLRRVDEHEGEGLVGDRRGATMVMGVFMAALLVGMIYYVWGIGDTIVVRERMQDAADTASFSAAVIHARGMNMLALINMIMAALAMVAATLQTIAHIVMAAAILATAICAGCGPWCGWCCQSCAPAVEYWMDYSDAQDMADDVADQVENMMEGLNTYAAGIRTGVPFAAQATVIGYGTDVYSPVTTVGILAPIRTSLPAEDDDSDWPCDEKVTPTVLIASPIGSLLYANSWHIFAVMIPTDLIAAPINSREWCEDEYFQRVIDDAQEMGNNEYQVQAYMVGDNDFEWTQEGVRVAAWGEGENEGSTYASLTEMGNYSFAQAEFFYDDEEDDWREWLWHMNWRARLRRWRLDALGLGGLGEAGVGGLGELVGAQDAVVH